MTYQSLFFECVGAIAPHRTHVLKWDAKNKTELPPVICVHGLTRMAHDFVDVAAALSQTRDVYSLSMAGRGESDWLSNPADYAYPNYAADCIEIITRHLALSQVDWLGTSMGGLIGMWIASLDALREKPLIRKLVLNDIGPFLPLSAVQRIAFYAGRSMSFSSVDDAERHCRVIYADFGIKGDAAWRFFAEKTVRPKVGGGYTLHYDPSIAVNFGAVKEDISVWPMYDALTCPTLLIRGARSDVLSQDIAAQMTQRGPKATLITFAGCGHAPALQDEAQISAIAEYLV